MKLESTSRKRLDRIGTLLLAFVLAVIVWVVSVQQENPVQATTLTGVPVEVVNLPETLVFANNGANEIPTVDVRVRGPRSVIESLSVRDLDASIDLTDARPDRQEVIVDVNRKDSSFDIVDKLPEAVVVRLERAVEKDVPVFANVIDSPPFGYTASEQWSTVRG